MRSLVPIFCLAVQCCCAQDHYQKRLVQVLEEIRRLEDFNNGVVVLDGHPTYGSTFGYWAPKMEYYIGDVVSLERATLYRAKADNKGKHPTTSPDEWTLIRGPHPYFYFFAMKARPL